MSDSRPSITLEAPAKLNVALSVGPPEQSGMHPIISWMVTVDLLDEVEVTRLDAGDLSRYAILWHDEAPHRSDIDWPITSDLCVRAHHLLEEHVGSPLPLQMKLTKRIPVGGGLGGGSSDAAAMLHAVNALFDLGLSRRDLAGLGATLGSDVPFLVDGGSAIVSGLGEAIEPQADLPEVHAVLVFPGVACPTHDVYRTFDELGPGSLRADAIAELARSGRPASMAPFNDLAVAAHRVAPTMTTVAAAIEPIAERSVHVTGSGSTLFVLCDDSLHAEALARALGERLDLAAVPTGAHQPDHASVRPQA